MTLYEKREAATTFIYIITCIILGVVATNLGLNVLAVSEPPPTAQEDDPAPDHSWSGAPITLVETYYSEGQPTWTYTTYEDGAVWIECHSEECHNAGHVQ